MSAQAATCAESSSMISESPASGSHSHSPISCSSPPPGRDQGTRCSSVSTACSQVALTPSQASVVALAWIATGPECTLPSVSNRAMMRAERKVSEESGRLVPVVSLTVTTAG